MIQWNLLLLLFYLSDSFIYDVVLVTPICCVYEGSHIVSVVIAALGVVVEGWGEDGAFVSV